MFLAVPWWRDAPGRTAEELRAVADVYWEDVPDLDRRRDRAARALGLDTAGLPSEAAALARLGELSRGPVAAACLVVGYEGEPLDPLFGVAPDRPTDCPGLDRVSRRPAVRRPDRSRWAGGEGSSSLRRVRAGCSRIPEHPAAAVLSLPVAPGQRRGRDVQGHSSGITRPSSASAARCAWSSRSRRCFWLASHIPTRWMFPSGISCTRARPGRAPSRAMCCSGPGRSCRPSGHCEPGLGAVLQLLHRGLGRRPEPPWAL